MRHLSWPLLVTKIRGHRLKMYRLWLRLGYVFSGTPMVNTDSLTMLHDPRIELLMRQMLSYQRASGFAVENSAGAKFEAIAQQNFVTTLMLFNPAETDETADGFVDSLARSTDHAGKFFLCDWQNKFIGTGS